MKHLLTLLIAKLDDPWWELRSSEGDPPDERNGQFILSALLYLIRAKLKRVEDDDGQK